MKQAGAGLVPLARLPVLDPGFPDAMPISHQIDPARHLVLSIATGVLTSPEILDGQRGLRQAAGFRSDLAQVLDVSRVTEVALTEEDVFTILANSPFGAGARRVLVMPAALQASHLGLIAAIVRELGGAFHVVENEREAFHWLEGPR